MYTTVTLNYTSKQHHLLVAKFGISNKRYVREKYKSDQGAGFRPANYIKKCYSVSKRKLKKRFRNTIRSKLMKFKMDLRFSKTLIQTNYVNRKNENLELNNEIKSLINEANTRLEK